MKQHVLALLGLGVGAALAMGVGCGGESRVSVTVEEGASRRQANLPSVPTLPPPPFPVQYPNTDQYSVYGIRHVAARNWTKQVTVKAYIVDVYLPCITPPGQRNARTCTERDRCNEERPHIYIADRPDETDHEHWMQVTGYAQFQSEIEEQRRAARNRPAGAAADAGAAGAPTMPVDFTHVGLPIVVSGQFVRTASNGQADANGLLVYRTHQPIEIPNPLPAGAREVTCAPAAAPARPAH